ncbi:hypothetical protein CUJ84_Chr001989 [Rhizobium leguminosarum]|uniref:Uncharacterized protein n=1 Tax=Rhizobium leguminosarum TaxID=384 RepID=A0A2K9Z297_RHILE|nr:hypothetical protein CUJ84_Chr001989 [Rhizobium leguminosarum]
MPITAAAEAASVNANFFMMTPVGLKLLRKLVFELLLYRSGTKAFPSDAGVLINVVRRLWEMMTRTTIVAA